MNDKTMFKNVQGMLTINYYSSNIYKEIFRRMGVLVFELSPLLQKAFFLILKFFYRMKYENLHMYIMFSLFSQ